MTAFETAFALLMKSLPIEVDWDNKKLPPPIEVEWDCKKCGKSKSGTDKCQCPAVKKGGPMDMAWRLLKSPLFYPEEKWEDTIDPNKTPTAREKEMFPDYMSDLMTPASPFGDISWESKDGMARGVAQTNFDTGQVEVHHFEVATTVRDGGLGESYLREMITELEQEMAGQTELDSFHAHATKVEPSKAGFWDKMVDRGAIHSASTRSNPRVTTDGKHFAPKISSDQLQPWEWPTEDEI